MKTLLKLYRLFSIAQDERLVNIIINNEYLTEQLKGDAKYVFKYTISISDRLSTSDTEAFLTWLDINLESKSYKDILEFKNLIIKNIVEDISNIHGDSESRQYIKENIAKEYFNIYHIQYILDNLDKIDKSVIENLIYFMRDNSEYFMRVPALKHISLEFLFNMVEALSERKESLDDIDLSLIDGAVSTINIFNNRRTIDNIMDSWDFDEIMKGYQNLSYDDRMKLARLSLKDKFNGMLSYDSYDKFSNEKDEEIREVVANGMPTRYLKLMFSNYPTARMERVLINNFISHDDIEVLKKVK